MERPTRFDWQTACHDDHDAKLNTMMSLTCSDRAHRVIVPIVSGPLTRRLE